MKNKISLAFVAAGLLLILGAVMLVAYNISEDRKSGESAEAVLEKVKSGIAPAQDVTDILEEKNDLFDEYNLEEEEPLIYIDGEAYIGYISIPSIGIELPVMSSWSYDKLNIAPCRYSGTIKSNDLIIAAHNYSSHFRKIESLSSGDEINVTAVDGKVYRYEVVNTEIVNGRDISAMLKNEGWELTLFTCNLSGQSRVTVRAVRTDS